MLYAFFTAITVLILIMIILIYFIIINKKCTLRVLRILLISTIVALAIIAYCIEPKITNDLYRHFQGIDYIRTYGFTAMKTYDEAIGAKILFYIVSLLPNNHFLPAIAAIITYGILFYIILDFCKNNNTSSRIVAVAILLNFSMCTYSTVISGVRNAMAFAFCALALYLDLIREQKGLKKIIPYLIAISIHPSTIMIIGCRLLLNLKQINLYKYLLLFWSFITKYLIKALYFIGTNITIYVGNKLQDYFMGNWIDDMRLLYVSIALVIVIYFITKHIKDEQYLRYTTFLQTYILLIIGSVFVAKIFVKRLLILMAFFMIPLVYLIEKNTEKKKQVIFYSILIFFMCGLIPYSVIEVKGNMGLIFNI